MARSVAELDVLLFDLYGRLSREYSEIENSERRQEMSDAMSSLEHQMACLQQEQNPRALAPTGQSAPGGSIHLMQVISS